MRSQLSPDKILAGVHTADDGTPVNFDGRYTVASMPGVAFYLRGWAQECIDEDWILSCDNPRHVYGFDPLDAYVDKDGDGDTHTQACYLYREPEQVDRTDLVIAVMVGDDHEHIVDVCDLTGISESDYCHGCGSTVCGHNRPDPD